jgi:hypothetical protein
MNGDVSEMRCAAEESVGSQTRWPYRFNLIKIINRRRHTDLVYRPRLERLGLTYPQYLVMLALCVGA